MIQKDNSVFPLDNLSIQDNKIIEPVANLHTSIIITHNPKILRYDWQSLVLAEPRDNTNFKPPNGNLHKSSYHRLGPEISKTGISETHEKLKEIESKDDYITVFPRRSTLNMFSYNLTEDERRKETLRLSGFHLNPNNYGCTDYRTMSNIGYPLHFPIKPKPSQTQDKPWLFYRRTLSYLNEELSNRNCCNKFYDDDMKTHNDIAALKIERYRSYDPVLKKFTEPCKFIEYKYKI